MFVHYISSVPFDQIPSDLVCHIVHPLIAIDPYLLVICKHTRNGTARLQFLSVLPKHHTIYSIHIAFIHRINSNCFYQRRNKKMISILTLEKSSIEMNTSLAISCCFMGFCCLVAAVARIVVSRTVNSPLVKELLYEAIAAAELCACCFELIIGK